MQFAIAIAIMIISYAITAAMMKKPVVTPPTAFKDFVFPIPTEGTPQAVVFGDCWISDWQVLWYGNYRTEEITSDPGGKK